MSELILKKQFEDYREGSGSLSKGGLLVSRLIDNDLNITWIYDELEAWLKKCKLVMVPVNF